MLAQASPNPIVCHPEAAESLAKPRTPNEGPMQLAGTTNAADESIGPSARKKRGPQDDNSVFHAFVAADQGGGEGTPEVEGKRAWQPLPVGCMQDYFRRKFASVLPQLD